MIDLPKGAWDWSSANARDMARIARALEKIAEEAACIRAAMEDDDQEDGRQ
jgi:hypothetical protein